MNEDIAPTLGKKPSRLSSVALTFIAITMVPAMAAVIAPANTASAPQESRLAAPGRYVGTDYIANPLVIPRRAAR
jgi:hypothetical protein